MKICNRFIILFLIQSLMLSQVAWAYDMCGSEACLSPSVNINKNDLQLTFESASSNQPLQLTIDAVRIAGDMSEKGLETFRENLAAKMATISQEKTIDELKSLVSALNKEREKAERNNEHLLISRLFFGGEIALKVCAQKLENADTDIIINLISDLKGERYYSIEARKWLVEILKKRVKVGNVVFSAQLKSVLLQTLHDFGTERFAYGWIMSIWEIFGYYGTDKLLDAVEKIEGDNIYAYFGLAQYFVADNNLTLSIEGFSKEQTGRFFKILEGLVVKNVNLENEMLYFPVLEFLAALIEAHKEYLLPMPSDMINSLSELLDSKDLFERSREEIVKIFNLAGMSPEKISVLEKTRKLFKYKHEFNSLLDLLPDNKQEAKKLIGYLEEIKQQAGEDFDIVFMTIIQNLSGEAKLFITPQEFKDLLEKEDNKLIGKFLRVAEKLDEKLENPYRGNRGINPEELVRAYIFLTLNLSDNDKRRVKILLDEQKLIFDNARYLMEFPIVARSVAVLLNAGITLDRIETFIGQELPEKTKDLLELATRLSELKEIDEIVREMNFNQKNREYFLTELVLAKESPLATIRQIRDVMISDFLDILAAEIGSREKAEEFLIFKLSKSGLFSQRAIGNIAKIITEKYIDDIAAEGFDREKVKGFLLFGLPFISRDMLEVLSGLKDRIKENRLLDSWQEMGVSKELAEEIIFVDSLSKFTDAEYMGGEFFNKTSMDILLRCASAKNISRIFKININLANYIEQNNEEGKRFLAQSSLRKEIINKIFENINRERTTHPSERRMETDQKTSLFEYLLNLETPDLQKAAELFNVYFKNDPIDYMVNMDDLLELLRYISATDLMDVIRLIKEDPKLSITEIEEKVRINLEGDADAEFVIRKLRWVISNMFIVESKVKILSTFIKKLDLGDNRDDTEKLRGFLKSINRAKNFPALLTISQQNKIALIDILRFKFNMVVDPSLEGVIASAITNQKIEKTEFDAVLEMFLRLPFENQSQIYIRVKNITESAMEKNKASPKAVDFLKEYGFLSKRVVEQKAGVSGMSLVQQIPHIFYEPLLKLGIDNKDDRIFSAFRDLINAMHGNDQFRKNRSLAFSKNNLYQQMIVLANQNVANNQDSLIRANIFRAILNNLMDDGGINAENVYDKFDKLIQLIMFYQKLLAFQQPFEDTQKKIRYKIEGGDLIADLTFFADLIVSETSRGIIDEKKHEAFLMQYGTMKGSTLIKRLAQRVNLSNEEEYKINAFCNSERFNWRDENNNDIYDLILAYLSRDGQEKDILFKEGLIRWIDGEKEFLNWRYTSPDYLQAIEMIIMQELKSFDEKERKLLDGVNEENAIDMLLALKIDQTEHRKLFQLQLTIKKLMQWQQEKEYDIRIYGKNFKVVFTGDFLKLFTVGHYPGSTSCQDCAHSNDFNIGLMGYMMNGSNKAVTIYDSSGNIVARRIVKLRIDVSDLENIKPIIFVEENTQFGMEGKQIDALYSMLGIISRLTGSEIASSNYRPAASSKLQTQGKSEELKLHLLVGRSPYEYSDSYGANYRTEPMDVIVSARVKSVPQESLSILESQAQFIGIETESFAESSENKVNKQYDASVFKNMIFRIKASIAIEQAV